MSRVPYSLAFAAAFMLFVWFGEAFLTEDMHRTLLVIAPVFFVLSLNRLTCCGGPSGRISA